MSEFMMAVWDQMVADRYLYLQAIVYALFACLMVRWIWHVREGRPVRTDPGLIEGGLPFRPGEGTSAPGARPARRRPTAPPEGSAAD